MSAKNRNTVAILLGSYNGEKFIYDQLNSIKNQTYKNWDLWVSDDGSIDKTIRIVLNFQQELGPDRVHLLSGPQIGFAANFLSMACNPQIESDFYAFSDQDDIWDSRKLQIALDVLLQIPDEVPAVYCGRTILTNSEGEFKGLSPLFKRQPGFKNALAQSIAGGNTMVFNRAACKLLRKAGWKLSIVSHDWWLYLVTASVGGKVIYDPNPFVYYRQHSSNLMGSNLAIKAKLRRVTKLLNGEFKKWNDANILSLTDLMPQMTFESRMILKMFNKARNSSLFFRLLYFKRSGLHRQTLMGNISLFFAVLVNKI